MEVETLKKLALLGAMKDNVDISSSTFASRLETSTQTAARRLAFLEAQGFITRAVTNEGQKVRITDKGVDCLMAEYTDYRKLFENGSHAKFKGKVTTGLGEGQYYIALDGYKKQFNAKLGFDPFPGTLNLILTKPFDMASGSVLIEGFKDANRTYGACRCYPIIIRDIPAAVVRPERSNYPKNLIEIIAPVNLRRTLGLKDGDEIEVSLR